MGLWNKVKGVFGRIRQGANKAFDWLKDKRETIETIADSAASLMPQDIQNKYGEIKEKAKYIF